MPFEVAGGDRELFRSGVHSDDPALFADHLRQEVCVLARARTKIEDRQPLDSLRRDEAAAIITRANLVMHIGQRRPDGRRRSLRRAAGVGPEVGRAGKHLAVISAAVLDVHAVPLAGDRAMVQGCFGFPNA